MTEYVERRLKVTHEVLREIVGTQNKYLNLIQQSFPLAKIVARGEDILLQGPTQDLVDLNALLELLINKCQAGNVLDERELMRYLEKKGGLSVKDSAEESRNGVIIHTAANQAITSRGENQKKILEAVKNHDIVFITGPAGTGKTFLAVALALRALRLKAVKRIVITRPAVEAGEQLGFLPGDLKEKMAPYLQPLYDALRQILSEEKLRFFKEKGTIEIAPLAYMRGRTLADSYVLLDEAQNATAMQLKMFLTRLGQRSKAIITGDLTQIDLPSSQQSGLTDALERLRKLKKEVAFVELDGMDVQRHPLVKKIIEAYESA